jgi:alpha-ribazole phosphatase
MECAHVIRLILVRHGQTIWNAQNRYQGQTDVPLSAVGAAQAEAVAGRLAGETIHAIYSSDLQRARDTASPIATRHRLSVDIDSRFREMSFGEWEGMTFAEINGQSPQLMAAWVAARPGSAPPAGETREALAERVQAAWREIAGQRPEQTVALVAHGGVLTTLLALALDLPLERRWRFRIDHATVSELHLYDDTAVLALLNDGCHLAGLDLAAEN